MAKQTAIKTKRYLTQWKKIFAPSFIRQEGDIQDRIQMACKHI